MVSSLALLSLLLIVSAFVFLLKQKKEHHWPPSPPGALPIIGHLHLLGNFPHRSLLELAKKYGGLMYLQLGSCNTLVVSTPEVAKELFKTHDLTFASRPFVSAARYLGYNGEDLAWAPYGEHWRKMRKFCTVEILNTKRVEMFKPLRKLEMSFLVKEILEACKQKSIVNMTTRISDLTFNTMTRIIINKSFSDDSSSLGEKMRALLFKKAINEGFQTASCTHLGDFIPWLKWMDNNATKMSNVHKRMDEFVQKDLEEHKMRQKNNPIIKDFMDVMLASGDLSDTMMKALSMDLLAGGTDTTAVTVEWGLAELLKNPLMLTKAREELDKVVGKERTLDEDDIPKLEYLNAVIKETFRLHPPGALLAPHESIEPCKIGDYVIPAKTRHVVNVYAIARDPKVWNEPDKFDPERFIGDGAAVDVKGQNFELIPFGSGRRICPGMGLALITVHYILGSLLHAFDWQMPEGSSFQDLDMEEASGLTVPRRTPLLLVASTRLSQKAFTMRGRSASLGEYYVGEEL